MTLVIIFKIVKDGTSLQFNVSLINQTACMSSDRHCTNGKDSLAEEGTGLVSLLLHFSTTPNNAAI